MKLRFPGTSAALITLAIAGTSLSFGQVQTIVPDAVPGAKARGVVDTAPFLERDFAVLAGVSDPFEATRYHSLIVERSSVPEELVVTAWTADGIVMGLRHSRYPTYGVQFHPESVLTKEGKKILANFIRRSEKKP